jgi:hypothetical protein
VTSVQIHFLETVDSAALTISPLEYEMRIAESKAKKREKETEWGRRAEELLDLDTREMIWKEDGQLLITGLPSSPPLSLTRSVSVGCVVSEYERSEKANRQSLRLKESESAELRRIYASLRERRLPHRLAAPPEASSSSLLSPPPPAPAPQTVSRDVQLHRALLLQQHRRPTGVEEGQAVGGVLESWQQEHLVSYFHRSVETLSLSDIHRYAPPPNVPLLLCSPSSPALPSGCMPSIACWPVPVPHWPHSRDEPRRRGRGSNCQ